MIYILQWTFNVEFLVDNLGRHTHRLIQDKYLTEEQVVVLYLSLLAH